MSAHAETTPPKAPSARASVGPWLVWVAAAVAAWVVVLGQPSRGPSPLDAEAWVRMGRFVARLLGQGLDATPAFAPWSGAWPSVLRQAVDTVAASVAAAGMAAAFALVTAPLAVRRRGRDHVLRVPVRAVHALLRGIPELVWAFLLVLLFRPSPFVGALALAVHNGGVVGRLMVDVLEDLDPRPEQALRTTGAGGVAVVAYSVLPRIVPRLLTFGLYRWEVIMRTTLVVEAVSGSGLGSTLRLALSARAFTTVTLVLAVYALLVLLADGASRVLRRLAR